MTHGDIVRVLVCRYPDAEWSYDGDGSTLDSVEDEDGVLLSRGLEWHGPGDPPSYDDLAKAAADVERDLALAALRTQRDELLKDSDWTQLPDAPNGTIRDAWASYRQELRDWPGQAGFDPLDPPDWPTPPGATTE